MKEKTTKEELTMVATQTEVIIREMRLDDIPGVHSVQCNCYPENLHETYALLFSPFLFHSRVKKTIKYKKYK